MRFIRQNQFIHLFSSPEDTFSSFIRRAKVKTNNTITPLLKYIEKSGTKMISTDVKLTDPRITRYILNVSIIAFDDVSTDIIKSDIADAVGNYFIKLKRQDRIPKSDLIAVLESLNSVDSVNVNILGEVDELYRITNPNSTKLYGLDDFNDIVIGLDEFPVLRGGWKDSQGRSYAEGLSDSGLGALNIEIKSQIPRKNIGIV
jgi:hypothetical protein